MRCGPAEASSGVRTQEGKGWPQRTCFATPPPPSSSAPPTRCARAPLSSASSTPAPPWPPTPRPPRSRRSRSSARTTYVTLFFHSRPPSPLCLFAHTARSTERALPGFMVPFLHLIHLLFIRIRLAFGVDCQALRVLPITFDSFRKLK